MNLKLTPTLAKNLIEYKSLTYYASAVDKIEKLSNAGKDNDLRFFLKEESSFGGILFCQYKDNTFQVSKKKLSYKDINFLFLSSRWNYN